MTKKEIEKIAELEHEQWMEWAKSLMKDEDLSPERIKRWKKLFVDYDKLSEKDKKDDRKWARKVDKELDESYTAHLLEFTKRRLINEYINSSSITGRHVGSDIRSDSQLKE